MIIKLVRTLFILLIVLTLYGCVPDEFKQQASQQFGDQHFKTTISLIELHKIREGEYPLNLEELKYTGDWDELALNSVEYKKMDNGYELNLTHGFMGESVDLNYPNDFWKGLGVLKSNLRK